jgi:hypothetical protein
MPKMIVFQAHGRILGDDGGVGSMARSLGRTPNTLGRSPNLKGGA